jgi:hypothetical protein
VSQPFIEHLACTQGKLCLQVDRPSPDRSFRQMPLLSPLHSPAQTLLPSLCIFFCMCSPPTPANQRSPRLVEHGHGPYLLSSPDTLPLCFVLIHPHSRPRQTTALQNIFFLGSICIPAASTSPCTSQPSPLHLSLCLSSLFYFPNLTQTFYFQDSAERSMAGLRRRRPCPYQRSRLRARPYHSPFSLLLPLCYHIPISPWQIITSPFPVQVHVGECRRPVSPRPSPSATLSSLLSAATPSLTLATESSAASRSHAPSRPRSHPLPHDASFTQRPPLVSLRFTSAARVAAALLYWLASPS